MANTWNQVGTLKGPKGDKGATGDAGPKGGSVRVASISVPAGGDVAFSALSPSDGVQVGDLVLDAKGSVYPISAVDAGRSTARVGSAINGVSLKGPKGETGAVGPKGADGTSITVKGAVGSKAALPSSAAIGDTYITNDTSHMWVKTAMSGDAQWTDLGEMKGPKGDKGATGEKGEKGDTGATGAQGPAGPGITFGQGAPTASSQAGAVYIDTADGFKVYQYGDNA